MWIAKPITALNAAERSAWIEARDANRTADETPLSQTLAWAEAIQGLGAHAYLVFSPTEGVGGVVHSVDGVESEFECINGPLLDWDDSEKAPRQLATFTAAVAKLGRPFKSLSLQPRWREDQLERRIEDLPVEPEEILEAATLQVTVQAEAEAQLRSLSARLRRSIARARRQGVQVTTEEIRDSQIDEFMRKARVHGQTKGFYVPDASWLRSLIGRQSERKREALRFWLTIADIDGMSTQLLSCVHGDTAHYLFGFDERTVESPSSLSTAAVAHFNVLEKCAKERIKTYDLNGFTDPADRTHSYAGVSEFKAQFLGSEIRYATPLFRIEA